MLRHRTPDRIVFGICLVVALLLVGYEAGAYIEQSRKDAACTAIPSLRHNLRDMTKLQQKRWIKYYLSKGGAV